MFQRSNPLDVFNESNIPLNGLKISGITSKSSYAANYFQPKLISIIVQMTQNLSQISTMLKDDMG